ncbi:amidohydrolase [Nakamurella endophytica]|uniref:Amidohydrolase n=1 Tax=Nakamurella endophytica TaxID=1748367 RepID=A0A917SUM6_9ACTN|nr:amidohydrolase [Nakamurella endophytica]GGL99708.1 amidohydrolase [Nakamurella endophytica]
MPEQLLLANATVLTMDGAAPEASAVAVSGDRIVAVGDRDTARAALDGAVREVDLAGATVVPGFIDAHHHLMTLGFWMSQIDCAAPAVGSVSEIVELVHRRAADTAPGEWIRGRGYDDNKLAERRHPTRWDLDAVSDGHPVMIRNASGHMSVVNSVALQAAGITRDTPDPVGGHIDVDADGEPTGLLQETAQELLGVPFLPTDQGELRRYLHTAGKAYLAAGVTSGHEAGIFAPGEFTVLQEAWADGTLALRTYMMIRTPMLEALEGVGFHTGFGDDMLRVGSIKIISDGSLIGRTAAVCQPFQHAAEDDLGLAMFDPDQLNDLVWRAHSRGWQLAIHAIGDRAIGMCLDAYDAAQARLPRRDARHRIEHCGVLRPDLIERMARTHVIPVGQPPFIAEFGDGFLQHLGPERCRLTYPLRSLLDAGIPVAGSSDSPVSSYQPLIGIQAAVTEKTLSGNDFAPAEALTVDEALALYTRNAAHAAFDENVKGTITPGKYADFAVLGKDPRAEQPDDIASIPVLATIRGGQFVYESAMV